MMQNCAQLNKALLEDYIDLHRLAEATTHLSWQLGHDFENLFDRKNMLGHLTGSGLVVNDKGQFMLIDHPYLKKWLQPGGHSEGIDILLSDTASTEIMEETGYSVIQVLPQILDLDTHFIPANPKKQEGPHYHHDVIFLFKAVECDPSGREFSDDQIRWFDLGQKEIVIYEEFKHNRRLIRALNKLAVHHKIDPDVRNLW